MLCAAATPRDRGARCPEWPATDRVCPEFGRNPDSYEVLNVRVNTTAAPYG